MSRRVPHLKEILGTSKLITKMFSLILADKIADSHRNCVYFFFCGNLHFDQR